MTVIINKQEELEALIDKNNYNNIVIEDDLIIKCNIDAYNINVLNIKADTIKAENINAEKIEAYNIKALSDIKVEKCIDIEANIEAQDIKACNIYANNIEACNIDAINIYANNIEAKNIIYGSFCIATKNLKCKKIKGKRRNSLHACLDQPIEYI